MTKTLNMWILNKAACRQLPRAGVIRMETRRPQHQPTAARHLDTWGHGGIVAPNLFGTLTTETDIILFISNNIDEIV